jgi:hypothetical protein
MDIGEATKRLAFIKYLYTVGVEQTKKPEPLCWASVLTFHDAVELLLQLTAEYVNVKRGIGDIHFLDYWSVINDCLKRNGKPEITQKISMERLNKARVNFKHYGIPPSRSAITGDFRISVTNFFEESALSVFGVKFSEISMLEIISYQRTREDLKKAEELLGQNKLEDSLDCAALAFQQLIDNYESTKTDKWGNSPFSVGPRSFRRFSGFSMDIKGELGDFIDWTRESLDSIQDIVRIIGFGIDYKKYAKFKLLTPYVLSSIGGTYSVQRKDRKPLLDDVRFCIDFVIESVLALQESDFEVREGEGS